MTARHPGHPDPLSPGDAVLLTDRKGRRFLVRLTPGGEYHFHRGVVAHDDLLGSPEGCTVTSSMGERLVAFRPTITDWTLKAPRGAQVIYPKDQALILVLGDICPGATVVEAGAGSGALSAALLRAIGPTGRLRSYERREEFAAVARKNVTDRFGELPSNWELVVGDLGDHLAQESCDRLVLDMLEPWLHVADAATAVRPGGILVSYTPTVPQVMRLREALDASPAWGMAQTSETLLRTWNVDGLAVRPDHRMVAHTAFLTVARRLAADHVPPAAPEPPPAAAEPEPGTAPPEDPATSED